MKNLQEQFEFGNVILTPPAPEDPVYDQVFGAGYIPQIDWEAYLPEKENQYAIPFCVSFSRLNAAEAVANYAGLSALNLSDRHLGVSSNTNKVGNSLQVVSETFRKNGIVKEEELPFTYEMLSDPFARWNEIFDTSKLDPVAKRYYGGNHSWVYGKEAMKQALAFSPLQIAIGIPSTYNDPIVKDTGKYYSYHAVLLYKIDDNGYYYIYDSVGPNFKRVLDKNFKIEQAKSFRDLPDDWKEKTTYELTTEMARYAWLTRPDLQEKFPASNRFISLDGRWNLYDWCRQYGPIEMPEVFIDKKMNWTSVVIAKEALAIDVKNESKKKESWFQRSLIKKIIDWIIKIFSLKF
jgi:hypothetical protein